jgi:hypothetical protein
VNHRVLWLDAADADFQRHYLTARAVGLANAFTAAAARVERVLERNPGEAGESRAGRRRLLADPPLTVEFEVFDDQRTVVVTAARYTPPRAG